MTETADRLAAALEARCTRRVHRDELWHAFLEAEPAFLTDVGKRARLATALDELAGAGRIVLPSARSFDGGRPPLPRFVTVGGPRARPPSVPEGRSFPWRPELAWAAAARLGPGQLQVLQAVNSWLRDGGAARPVVPARERSLQVFGDEKAIDRLSRSMLFGPARLGYELLRCRPVHAPFVWRRTGAGAELLVVENHHSFETLASVVQAGGPVGMVAYGAGNHFIASVASIGDLDPVPERVWYFGDLDSNGLRIPVAAGTVAGELGLPAPQPAVGLYQLLLDHGRPAPARSPPLTAGVAAERVAWLPDPLRAPVAQLLTGGMRMAQEWVGTELLLDRMHEPVESLLRPRKNGRCAGSGRDC